MPCIVLLALVTASDACSTRSTPKARSSYISQLHQQQQPQQYPRPAQHYPPLLPRHPSPILDTPTPSQTVPQQQPQKSPLIPSVPTVSDADLTTQRPNVTFRTYPCPEAYAKWYCLNGAHCFSVKIGESVLYNCECADGYMGQRCEFKDLDGTYIQRRGILIQTASIAATVLVIVLVVIIISLCMVHSSRQQQFHSKNGQYVYRNWNAVITTKQVPVTVLTPEILARTV
ncbi:protein spitz-like [Galendromus occidentalis]|uniref:Protein spitz-like n=1 Tax=Galendromus occidentalis TaxID=34638 RepID=A0AAJ7SFU9_9ACAR|nr:protein spitz-like [Galendromus occidentalis]